MEYPKGAGESTLEGRGLHLERNDTVVFSDLDFRLGAGRLLQVEGRNGSGKTSLLRIACGLTRPTAGSVHWCGTDIAEDPAAYGRAVAYVGHEPGIKQELTATENLGFAAAVHGARRSLGEALDAVGIAPWDAERPCGRLSAGQRRRVALARLLLSPARLWVLDEPFTALDREGRGFVERLLSDHAAQGGMAVVTTHHALDLAGADVEHLNLS